jgi:putative solute:sodium symporter small subunit
MNNPYKKECLLTLVAFFLAAFLTHIYPLYFLFPGLTQLDILGYPAHYFLTLFIGWVVLMPLYWIYVVVSEKIDREMAQTSMEKVALEEKAAKGGAR